MSRFPAIAVEQLFHDARTFSRWTDRAVDDATLASIHEWLRWGPTSANCCPLRIVFVRNADGKARLLPCLDAGNVEKTRAAPVTAILAMEMAFPEQLPRLYPHDDARAWFAGNEAKIAETAFRNSSLQAGYFVLAARAHGLDCGPMSGFDAAKVDAAFLSGTTWRSNFLCNLGHGDRSTLHPRGPRLTFDDACRIV
jgi:3-hydroxypropanoate dehydrogenase